jgi:hypothetical protein
LSYSTRDKHVEQAPGGHTAVNVVVAVLESGPITASVGETFEPKGFCQNTLGFKPAPNSHDTLALLYPEIGRFGQSQRGIYAMPKVGTNPQPNTDYYQWP